MSLTRSYTPRVGDMVKITKSETNWVKDMDQYIDKVFRIKEVKNAIYPDSRTFTIVEFYGDGDDKVNTWNWVYEDNHFKPFREKKTLKLKLKFNANIQSRDH